jgi:hypothetical protein
MDRWPKKSRLLDRVREPAIWQIVIAHEMTMLNRFSSLILALVISGSMMAGTRGVQRGHVCEMAGMEGIVDMEAMPCCEQHQSASMESLYGSPEPCCVNVPPAPGSSGSTYNLRAPSFSVTVIHPAVAHSPLVLPQRRECPYSPRVFLPNLQASYIRNLALLI